MSNALIRETVPVADRAEELRARFQQPEWEVSPIASGATRRWIKASTAGTAAAVWAQTEDSYLAPAPNSSAFHTPVKVSVAEVLDGGAGRGVAKFFTVQVRFTRTYDVLEAK